MSCYELGRQPFNIASPWAQLEAAGFGVDGVDTALDPLDAAKLEVAQLVAISVPMHTALRLGVTIAEQVRSHAPHAHICFFGLYAALNSEFLLAGPADSVIGGEFEVALVELADGLAAERQIDNAPPLVLRRLPFVLPRRDGLAPLDRYATFHGPEPDERRKVGYVEASRGCKHRCLHCPITPVYGGRFFAVPRDIVLQDAEQQIAAGAQHITFGDPDFFNGPTHSMRIARALHASHPDVSYDVTVKIEHILAHPTELAELGTLGCAFVVSAVESLSDDVLRALDKGHSRADVARALEICHEANVALRPSLVAFTPWTTIDDYVELVDWIVDEALVDSLEPIQLAIRLLIPPGSALLANAGDWLGRRDDASFGYQWAHPDPRMDALYEQVSEVVENGVDDDPGEVVLRIREVAYRAAGRSVPARGLPQRRFVPRLSEAWFCCAEPSAKQMAKLGRR